MGRVGQDAVAFRFSSQFSALDMPAGIEGRFIAPQYFERDDVAVRQSRIAGLVSGQIIPRLVNLHRNVAESQGGHHDHPTDQEIAELAHLVLSADPQAASAYIVALRDRGLSMDTLFVELLEPAARHLGEMWERDECDFIDVTLGVGRLQKLLAVFNCTHDLPAFNESARF
jgi:MerR family transcriptional regulator, light-induced transcriptional regulator